MLDFPSEESNRSATKQELFQKPMGFRWWFTIVNL